MGGRHKKSIIQIEKQQKPAKLKAVRGEKSKSIEKNVRNVIFSSELIKQIKEEITNKRYITPSLIALKYNLRLSIAKNILKKLEREGKLSIVSKRRRLIIYRPIAAS